jgi:FlaA1/EpsC-like NDP-sugar epimerase
MQLKDIDPEDLLGREAVKLDLLGLAQMINDKIVLVTGAGGSIGSELTRQIAHFKPKALILFELSEFLLHEIEIELKAKFPKLNLISIVGDVKNFNELKNVFTHYRPELILHAAAYKHVPLMERNPRQAVITNILGTQNVARLAREFACARMVMISTDKAVNPTNVMGATKRIAEMIVNSEQEKTNQTIFTTVRFGNVLGSNGSVIPLFKKQIETGGPITVTHPEITRYFMSIPEACQLVLQSAAMSFAGQIFVLDMGSPIKIVDLAKQMISMAGYIPEVDIKIEFTGLREGEKLYEELLADEENTEKTAHQSIRIGQRRENPSEFNQFINELIGVDTEMSREQIHFLIKRLVPEFHSHLLDKQDEGAQVH